MQITDPQSQSAYPQADPNINAVENAQLDGTQDDNQRILARQTTSGTSRGVQQLGGPSLQADSGNKQITVSEGLPSVLMGSQPVFGEGFYVTKAGKDVTSANLTLDDLIFNSNQNTFKIVRAKNASVSFLAASYSFVKVAHNLGYAPVPLAFLAASYPGLNIGVGYTPLPTYFNQSLDTVNSVVKWGSYLFTVTDSTNIYFICGNATASAVPAFTIKYYLLQESAQ